MKQSIENYIPQVAVQKAWRQAIYVWSVAVFSVGGLVFLILLAPFAEANDFTSVSNPIYRCFGFFCHQMPSRSFQLENHSFAVCARCFGIYFGLFSGLIAYPVFRSIVNIEPLPRFWLFAALIPMAIDWSLGFFGVWENTHFSRFLTGVIVGTACAFYIVPALIEFTRFFQVKENRKGC